MWDGIRTDLILKIHRCEWGAYSTRVVWKAGGPILHFRKPTLPMLGDAFLTKL